LDLRALRGTPAMSPSKPPIAPLGHQRQSKRVMVLLGVLGAVHLLTSFSPGISTWGIDYWSSFPVAARFVFAAVLALFFLPPVARVAQAATDYVRQRVWYLVLCGAGLVALFVVLRSRVHVYGDGYSFVGYFAGGRLPDFSNQLGTQALDLIAHWAVYRAIVMPLGGPVETSYVILGAIAGLLSIWAIVRIARVLCTGRDARRLIVAAGISSVAVTFWFGYVESYSLTNAAILWALAFAMEARSHPWRIWAAWGVWILAAAFHQLAVALLPALIWAHWRAYRPSQKELHAGLRPGIFAVGFAGWLVATSVYSLVRANVFVPLWPTADSIYTAFSWHHFIDMFNLALLLAPIGLVGAIMWLTDRDARQAGASSGHGIIAVAAASMWFFSFWVDPLLGAFRDWDLLAGFGIPLSVWGGSVIVRRQSRGGVSSSLWALVAAFAVIHAGAFIATLQNPQGAMMRVDRLVRQDVHYSGGFFHGKRLAPWAAVLQIRFDRNDMAKDHLGRRVLLEPTDAQAWGNLAGAYRLANMTDSARVGYEQALKYDTTNLKYAHNLGMMRLEQGDNSGARDAFTRAAALSDTAYNSYCMLGVALVRLKQAREAGPVLDEAVRRFPDRFDAYYYRGAQREMLADTAGAIKDFETALERGGRVEEVYTRLCQLYQWSGHPGKAIEAARRWEQQFPKSSEAPFLEGTSYVTLKQYDSAASALSRCLWLKPDDALATYYLATTCRKLGQPERAKDLALQASRLDTTLALPYLELVYLAADAGDRAAAGAATREYLRRSPGDSAMSYLRQFLRP